MMLLIRIHRVLREDSRSATETRWISLQATVGILRASDIVCGVRPLVIFEKLGAEWHMYAADFVLNRPKTIDNTVDDSGGHLRIESDLMKRWREVATD